MPDRRGNLPPRSKPGGSNRDRARTQLDLRVYNMAHKSRAAAADFQTTIRARLERTIEYSLPAKSCRARGHMHIQAAKGPWDRIGRGPHARKVNLVGAAGALCVGAV